MAGVGKGRGRELGRETAREEGGRNGTRSFPFSLARPTRSRAPKFPLPLPLLTPATQANVQVSLKVL